MAIDDRKRPEDLPYCSVTSDLYVDSLTRSQLRPCVRQPLLVPIEDCPRGILVRVTIWPRHLEPTEDEMVKGFNSPPNFEPLVKTFIPTGFTNPVIFGAFSIDCLQRDAPFFIDEPLRGASDRETYSNPITLHGSRKAK